MSKFICKIKSVNNINFIKDTKFTLIKEYGLQEYSLVYLHLLQCRLRVAARFVFAPFLSQMLNSVDDNAM
jgi:hypothetical protein